jgi:hypothetical protein
MMRRMVYPMSAGAVSYAGHYKYRALRCQDSSESLELAAFTSVGVPIEFSLGSLFGFGEKAGKSSISCDDSFSAPWVTSATWQKAKELASARFQKGNYWVWLYRDPSGQPWSWERYSVKEVNRDGEITIEMSSRFRNDDEYNAHHRMKFSLGECLAARLYHKSWRFRDFSFLRDGEWCDAPFNDNVQAFEEKFNVLLMDEAIPTNQITKERSQLVEGLGTFEESRLVQTARHSYTNSWYAHRGHEQAGLAASKTFADEHAENGHHYAFELIEVGHVSSTCLTGF